eukprot:544586_1
MVLLKKVKHVIVVHQIVMIDRCCDGVLCSLYGDAECSNTEDCCHDCKIKGSDSLCRELSNTNTCDMEQEYCDGVSAICPYDKKHVEGTQCSVVNSHSPDDVSFGYCYYGECVSIEQQCALHGSYALSSNCGWDVAWKTSSCADSLQCGYTFDELQCNTLFGEVYNVGTPCYDGGSSDVAMQCIGHQCLESSAIYTHVYITSGWSACSIPCRDENSTEIGYQTRSVSCGMQDGTIVDDAVCDAYDIYKPSHNRTCHDFVCDFCAILLEKPHVCHPHGDCDSNAGICVCHWGYGGQHCQIEPSLFFMGITSHVYLNLNGITVAERADPCEQIGDFYDIPSKTQTLSIASNTLSDLYIGSVVGIRWNSTGAFSQLSVGMSAVDEENNTQWPFYVGISLAADHNQACQMSNESVYDPCLVDLSCNDFSFVLPDDLMPGNYKILVRYNKEYYVESDVFMVHCANHICAAAENGQCAVDDTDNVCECDEYWYGNRCDHSVCKPWTIIPHSCESDVFCDHEEKPKCLEGVCDITNINDELCECNLDHDGMYCELPNNYCNTITDPDTCASAASSCTFDSTHGCVFSDCFALTNAECTDENALEKDQTWPIYCEWNDNGYCDRISCDLNDFALCSNGAVRRPLLDDSSICYTWYCDCHTTPSGQYWDTPTPNTLLSFIKANYPWNTALNASYVTDIDLFTCAKCALNCSHNSVANTDCTACDDCDRDKWEGIGCNHMFWIAYFKLNVAYHTVMDSHDTFISTVTQDLIYFFSVPQTHISVYDIRSIDGGANTILYFKYLFDPNVNEQTIQTVGGDVMMNARRQASDALSPAVTRGFVTTHTDFTYELDWCLPTKEVCNHELKEIDYIELFGYCALFSYLFLGFCIVAWILGKKAYFKWKKNKQSNQQKEARQPLSPILQNVDSPPKKYYGSYSEVLQLEGVYSDGRDGL